MRPSFYPRVVVSVSYHYNFFYCALNNNESVTKFDNYVCNTISDNNIVCLYRNHRCNPATSVHIRPLKRSTHAADMESQLHGPYDLFTWSEYNMYNFISL